MASGSAAVTTPSLRNKLTSTTLGGLRTEGTREQESRTTGQRKHDACDMQSELLYHGSGITSINREIEREHGKRIGDGDNGGKLRGRAGNKGGTARGM